MPAACLVGVRAQHMVGLNVTEKPLEVRHDLRSHGIRHQPGLQKLRALTSMALSGSCSRTLRMASATSSEATNPKSPSAENTRP